ncbi:unnamed protein product [Knipowitschia caucasica]|uniref:General transcription factor IIIC, polypeptide 2, beta n=1 Tax=Knipowitschia caucasica TaxID=637954 RepID=A0AAV2KDJ4_KNICA
MQTPSSPDASNSAPDVTSELSPSSRGRQRKKNSRFTDFHVSEVYDGQTPAAKRRRTAVSAKAKEQTEEEEQEEGYVPPKLPTRRGRKPGRKPGKKPGRKPGRKPGEKSNAAAAVVELNGEGGAEVETPKPKRKYTKRKREEVIVKEVQDEQGEAPEEEDTGTRPKRGAARAALKYLRDRLAETEEQDQNQANGDNEGPLRDQDQRPGSKTKTPTGRRRKLNCDSDADSDKDFVLNAETAGEEEEDEYQEEEEEEEEEEGRFTSTQHQGGGNGRGHGNRCKKGSGRGRGGGHSGDPKGNGVPVMTSISVQVSKEVTSKFRQGYHSSWMFPDWIPSSSHWQLLPHREAAEEYLPQERQSVQFCVSREGSGTEEPQTLHRFCSSSAHSDRWDSVFFCGGPLWSLEWCPTPDHCEETQYIALSCHRDMDETHRDNQVYSGPGLVQVWDLGRLQNHCRPDQRPALVYSLAQDQGFVWGLKWCPAGTWEKPETERQAPLMPRLGLLAVASSLGVVSIYSLPHPDALLSLLPTDGSDTAVYKVKAVVTLKLGSFKAPRVSDSGLVLSLDWVQHKPHNLIAVGFYDGHVGLWDLSTRSSLLRIRESDGSMTLLPFQCFIAHDLPVRHVSFAPASRNLLVSTGEDRFTRTWDLSRVCAPVTEQKRNINTEIVWPLSAPGLLLGEENAYAAFKNHGVHFYDHQMSAMFSVPRSGTMWSIAYSDWLNFLVTADTLGDVILCTLPLLSVGSLTNKRTQEKRFPLQFCEMVPVKTSEEGTGCEHKEGGGTGSEHKERGRTGSEPFKLDLYRDAAKKYSLKFTDFNTGSLLNYEQRPLWKKMRATESSASLKLDHFALAALHKIRFSPNFSSHTWIASGGQSGLVRLLCVRCANFKHTSKYQPLGEPESLESDPEDGSFPVETDQRPAPQTRDLPQRGAPIPGRQTRDLPQRGAPIPGKKIQY